jgi:hypothetical protein
MAVPPEVKVVKDELRSAGIRGVTVRGRESGFSSHVVISVRKLLSPEDMAEVRRIARSVEHVRLDHQGVPLQGGNTWVELKIDPTVIERWAGPIYNSLRWLPPDGTPAEIGEQLYAWIDQRGHYVVEYQKHGIASLTFRSGERAHVAETIALWYASGRAQGRVAGEGEPLFRWPPVGPL